jgi:hypothetical protein
MCEKDGRLIFVGRFPARFSKAIESTFSRRSIDSIEYTGKILISNDIFLDTVTNVKDNEK